MGRTDGDVHRSWDGGAHVGTLDGPVWEVRTSDEPIAEDAEDAEDHGDDGDLTDTVLGTALPQAPLWSPPTKIAVGAGFFVVVLIIVWLSRGIFSILAVSALIAFLLAPLIRLMHDKWRVPRGLALVITYIFVLLLTLSIGVLLTGSVIASVRELDPADLLENIRAWILSRIDDSNQLVIVGVTLDLSQVLEPIQGWLRGEGGLPINGDGTVIEITPSHLSFLFGGLLGSVQSVVGIIVAIFTSALVTALIAVYLNVDSRRYHAAVVRLVPPGYEGDAARISAAIKKVWTGYMYGQLVNSLITGLMVWAVLALVGLPGAFLMGFIMMIFNMIPTIGPILAAIPGVIAALVQGTTRFDDMNNLVFALLVAGIYVVVVQLQANLIAPRVMGSAVNLPPAVVMLGLIIGLQLGGLIGSLLAVPVIATGREVFRYAYLKLIDRDPWARPEAAADAEPSVV